MAARAAISYVPEKPGGMADPGHQDFELEGKDADGETTTVLQWLAKERVKHERRGLKFEAKALRNELYYLGEQFKDVSEDNLEIEDMSWQDDVPQVYRNYMRPLINTYSARMQKDRPSVKAKANTPEAYDLGAVDVANALIYHVSDLNDVDDLLFQATPLAQCHGKVAIKTVWDPTIGPPSAGEVVGINADTGEEIVEGEGEPSGEVSFELVTLFDYFADGSPRVDDSHYVVFTDHVSRDDAKARLEEAGLDDDVETVTYSDLYDEEEEGAEVFEIWVRPCPRFRRGWYALVVSGHVVEYLPTYPYPHHELPISEWFINPRRGSPYGSSHVDDAVVIQRQINELVSVIHKITRDCGNLYFVGHPALIEAIEGGATHNIAIASDAQRKNNGWIDPPNPPPLLFAQLETLVKVLYDVFGLNEILTGQENVRAGTSARQIAYLTELDSQKLAGAARSLARLLKRMWRQALRLYQHFVTEDRLIEIAGGDRFNGVVAFTGADLGGVDVRLEPASGLELLGAAEGEEAMQDTMAGLIPPAEGLERRATGQDRTAMAYWQGAIVHEQIRGALAGAAVAPDPQVDPQIAIGEIRGALEIAKRQPVPQQLTQNLLNLMLGYQQMAQQMAQQQPTFAPQPAPPPGRGGHPVDAPFQEMVQ